MTDIKTIIFDLGAVLIDWNPHYLYETIFEQEEERHHFFQTVCTAEWNEEQDGGRSLHEATELLVTQFPHYETAIRAFYGRYPEMLRGPIMGTLDIFRELKESGNFGLYALTNWSAETFPVALEQFDFCLGSMVSLFPVSKKTENLSLRSTTRYYVGMTSIRQNVYSLMTISEMLKLPKHWVFGVFISLIQKRYVNS